MGSCYSICKIRQSEQTSISFKSIDIKTPAAIKLQKAYKSYKSRKLIKFIIKRKKNIADGIEIKQNWDCTNRLKIPEGFEYTQQNISYLRKEILNFYNLFFKFNIKSTKISISEEDLLHVTKDNFLEKFKSVILWQMMKDFDLGSKNNDLIGISIDDTYNEKLLTSKFKEYSKVLSVSFGEKDNKNKWSLLKGIKEEDQNLDESNCNVNLENTMITRTNTNILSNKDATLNPAKISITSAVKNIFSMYRDSHKEKENFKEKETTINDGNSGSIKQKRVKFKSDNNPKHILEISKRNSNSTQGMIVDEKTPDKKMNEEHSPKYFSLSTFISSKNFKAKLLEEAVKINSNSSATAYPSNTTNNILNNTPSFEKILSDILSQTDTGDFLTFLDKEEGTFYEGTIYGYYDKQGLGIELLFDKSKGLRYKYLGYFYKNLFHGYGIIAYENGLFYKGEFRMGKRTGYGIEISQTSIYRGFFLNNKYNGYGELKGGNEIYFGNFENGLKEGFGYIEYDENISHRYIGRFRHNLMDGVGLLMLPNQNYYYGEFKDNEMNGRGQFKWPSGDVYIGGYFNNKRHGDGEYYTKSNNVILKGSWVHGEKFGKFKVIQLKTLGV
jgi:hypothetical protein